MYRYLHITFSLFTYNIHWGTVAHLYCNQVHRCTSIETRYKEIVELEMETSKVGEWQLPSAADECMALQLFADDLKDISFERHNRSIR